jgi:hypothetical protein
VITRRGLCTWRFTSPTRALRLVAAGTRPTPEAKTLKHHFIAPIEWTRTSAKDGSSQMGRHFINTSAEAIGIAARGAYESADIPLLREAISELSQFRTSGEARRVIEGLAPLLQELEKRTRSLCESDDGAQPSKKWLAGVQAAAGRYASRSSDSCSVYLVLLRKPQAPDTFGVYVGETSLTPEERFYNHKNGHKPSSHVRKWGVRLLRPFFDHLEGISRVDAQNIERELAESLRHAGYWVEGGH